MFKIQPNPIFEATIAIPVPGGGESKLKLKFKRLGKKALRDLFAELESAAKENKEVDDAEVLLKIIEGWSDVDVEFSREAIEQLCDNYPGAVNAIVGSYSSKMFGAVEKN